MTEKDEFHVRTLKEVDKQGRIISERSIYDLDAMLRKYGLLPPLEDDKKEGELIPFPK